LLTVGRLVHRAMQLAHLGRLQRELQLDSTPRAAQEDRVHDGLDYLLSFGWNRDRHVQPLPNQTSLTDKNLTHDKVNFVVAAMKDYRPHLWRRLPEAVDTAFSLL